MHDVRFEFKEYFPTREIYKEFRHNTERWFKEYNMLVRRDYDVDKKIFIWSFEKIEDAVAFKLRWS